MCNLCKGLPYSEIIEGDIRISEEHVGTRFGDHTSQDEGIRWIVLLEGIDVTHICSEAIAGTNGAVVIIEDKYDYCLVTGKVEVKTEEWTEDVRDKINISFG